MSKVRRFDMDRIRAEIDWFSRMKIKSIILADANFGILPRDLEIADLLNETRDRRGYPRFMHYSPAKNNPERTVEIAKKFVRSGLSPVHTFAIQHTNPVVLAAADRDNISVSKQRQVAKAVVSSEIPTLVQLIVGIPGDSYDLWKTCLTDLMDWGLHDNYQIFNYSLLPNAPAADGDFLRRWEVETITRFIPKEGTGQRDEDDRDALTSVDLIVGCKSYSREDWVRMKVYSAFIKALHNRSLTRLIAMYLHFTHGVSYRRFYDDVVDSFLGGSSLYRELTSHFRAFIWSPNALEDLRYERIQGHPLCFESSRWVFIEICRDFDRWFEALKTFLTDRYAEAANLESAMEYQRNLVILPRGRDSAVRSFRADFDWIRYFDKARLLTSYEPLPEPDPVPGGNVVVGDRFDWEEKDSKDRWLAWIEHTREVQRAMSINFRDLRLQRKAV
jgi:putative methyltransferase